MIVLDDLTTAVQQIKSWLSGREPQLAIVLGSGLGSIIDRLEGGRRLPYTELDGFPASGVAGHAGCLHSGTLYGVPVLLFQGRYHCYEGYSAWQVTAPVRLAAALGCRKLLLTNAAGGIDDTMLPGDFMLVTDHINMTGESPLRGRSELEFVDLGQLYQHHFYSQLKQQLAIHGIKLHAGVLAWMMGPNYETPAEIAMLSLLGVSAVSMSTIPEAIVARRYGLEVAAVSYISNLAAGKTTESLDHQDVLDSGKSAATSLEQIFTVLLNQWLD